MKKEMISLGLIIMCMAVLFSGCTTENNSTNTNNQGTIGLSESFSADTSAGQYSILDDTVEVNVYSGSVSEPVNITVESITNPVQDSSLVMLSCYEFRPDGLTFARPIDVILHYNLNDIPSGVAESALKVYVLNGSSWEPIKGSFANEMMHYAVAKVSHFSKMACGGPAPSHSNPNDDSGSGSENDTENTSAQYWFKADLYFYQFHDLRLNDWDDDTMYTVGVSAYWDPVSYVQYYQIKFVFNGNPPDGYSFGCDFREQNKNYCPKNILFKEGYIYHLGNDPNLEGFIGYYDTGEVATAGKVVDQETGEMEHYVYGRLRPEGAHGFNLFGVYDTVEDAEQFSDLQIVTLNGEMETFVNDYVAGWEVWVRGVTERGG